MTSTTHKTLRGPRGGFVLTNDEDIAKKINSAVFPGLQGGPLMHVIAGKAVAFGEALQPGFKTYIDNVLANAQALGEVLKTGGVDLVTGGTDNHLLLVDLRPKGLKGNQVEQALERAGITCNKNGIPFDTEKPTVTSGVRLGTPAGTTRGFGVNEFRDIGRLIVEVLRFAARPSRRPCRHRTTRASRDFRAVRTLPHLLRTPGAQMSNLHENSIIIDGLNISKFERSVFEDMRKGGVTAVNCTVSVWEELPEDHRQHRAK